MSTDNLEATVQALLAPGKGILAADETVGTISKRFESLGIVSNGESRRTYRELLFSTPGHTQFVSGVIMSGCMVCFIKTSLKCSQRVTN